jgi:hypothetical protein
MRTRRFLSQAQHLRALIFASSVSSVKCSTLLFFVALFLALPAHAQETSADALSAAGCGPDNIRFEAKGDKNSHPLPQPDPGKALIYFIGDTRGDTAKGVGLPVTRIGIDGQWVAANAMGSYVSFQVEPGDHRMCINFQTVIKSQGKYHTATSFTAVAGETYYFHDVDHPGAPADESVVVRQMDPAEALVLIAKAKFTTWQQKK